MTNICQANLAAHILPRSLSQNFAVAKSEWTFVHADLREDWYACPCGHPIKELCYVHNRFTHAETYVGNICVNKFMGIDTGTLFEGLKRIARNPVANPNIAVIAYAWNSGYLHDEREYDFLMRISRKRSLSLRQIEWKEKINRRIMQRTAVAAPRLSVPQDRALREDYGGMPWCDPRMAFADFGLR